MLKVLGIDSSNYTSSAAVWQDGKIISNAKQLLPVKEGELGLRQSDAVFHHVQNLPGVIESALSGGGAVSAIGVSVRPRDVEGSYMPCFTVGQALARAMAVSLSVPVFTFSHQVGHIAAALYSAGRLSLLREKFIAFHVSGGTTEAVLVTPDKDKFVSCELLAGSLDLKAGQAVDRVGGMLGLGFPAGMQLDKLAVGGKSPIKPRPVFKGCDCCFSGIENKAAGLVKSGEKTENIARYCIDYICAALDGMTERLLDKYGALPLVFAGGVMSNSIIRNKLSGKYGAVFAAPEFSSDNGAGVAILAAARLLGEDFLYE